MKKCFFSSYLFFLFCLFFILHFWFASLFQPKLKHLKGNNCQLKEPLCTASHPCSCFCMICGWLRCWNIGKGTIVRHINLNLLLLFLRTLSWHKLGYKIRKFLNSKFEFCHKKGELKTHVTKYVKSWNFRSISISN